jgi:membrane protein required for colicin V production
MNAWNGIDWVLAAVVLISVVLAIRRGFLRELIALATLIVAVAVAALEYRRAAAWYEDLTRSHEVALGAAFLTLFIGVLLLGAAVSAVTARLVKTAGLEWFDRFVGGAFGFVRGVVIDSVLLMILVAFAIKPDQVRNSTLAPYVTTGARLLALAMPSELKTQFRAGLGRLRQGLAQNAGRTAPKPN